GPMTGAAVRLQGTRLAVALAGPVAYRVVFHHAGPRGRELPTIMLECLPGWAAVGVTGVVVSEVFAREGPVGALGFVEHWDMRLDPALMDKPVSISAEP